MQFDENENEIVDYFGEPHLLVSTLHFHIDELGQCIFLQKTMVLYVWKKNAVTKIFVW